MMTMPARLCDLVDDHGSDPISIREYLKSTGMRPDKFNQMVMWNFCQQMSEEERKIILLNWLNRDL